MAKHYNLENIRTLLTEGFTAEKLRRFCYDKPDFRPVYNRLAEGTGKTKIVDQLIEHADQKLQFDALLAWAKKRNPARYEKHQPYYDTSPTTSSGTHGKPQKAIKQRWSAKVGKTLRSPTFIVTALVVLVVIGISFWSITNLLFQATPTATQTLIAASTNTLTTTSQPTEEPTVELTKEPPIEPIEETTIEPTEETTIEPTEEPTIEPTKEPTIEPTEEPTPRICPPANAEGTVSPAVAIYSITFVVNGEEQVVNDTNPLQASPVNQLLVKEVTICPVEPFGGNGGNVYIEFDPVDQNGIVIGPEVKGTQAVGVTSDFTIIPGPVYTWTIDNWRHLSVNSVHYPPGGGTQDPNCEGGICEVDDRVIVGIQ